MDRALSSACLSLVVLAAACGRAPGPADAARARLAAWGLPVSPASLVRQSANYRGTDPARDLLSLGVSPDAVDASGTPAVVAGVHNLEYLRLLLAAGANPNAADATGRCALHSANEPGIQLLVQAGAAVNVQDAQGLTPLHAAAQAGDAQRVAALLAAGASPDLPDVHGRTPLMQAVESNTPEVLRRVLAAHPNLELADEDGYTALLLAVRRHSRFALMLLAAGASPHAMTRDGRTAVQLANTEGVEAALVAAGAAPERTEEP